MTDNYDHLVGKYAYKNHEGMFGKLVGKVAINESELGITPLVLLDKNGANIVGAFPQDLAVVEDIKEAD